jgi:hypothetical protein
MADPPPYVPPPGAHLISDTTVATTGARTILYDEKNGQHHKIVIQKGGAAHETIWKDPGGPEKNVEYTVEFKSDTGERQESVSSGTNEARTTTTTTFDDKGRRTQVRQVTDTDASGERPATSKRTVTTYDANGDRAEKVVEEVEFEHDDDEAYAGVIISKGKKTVTKYKNHKPSEPETYHWDTDKRDWVAD